MVAQGGHSHRKGVAMHDKLRIADDEVIVAIGGLGGSLVAYWPTCEALRKKTGINTLFAASLRYGKPSQTEYVGALELQAWHIADWLRKKGLRNKKIRIVAHSLGVPIAAIFADVFGSEFDIVSFAAVCPAGVYRENFFGLGLRIARKIVRDLCTPMGRTYWGNSLRYFKNPIRSLREGWAVSRFGATADILRRLADRGVRVTVALAPDDDVFSYRKLDKRLKKLRAFTLRPGTRHSPDYRPEALAEQLLANNAP